MSSPLSSRPFGLPVLFALLLSLCLPGCSGGNGGDNALLEALQDLGLDPDGRTTVLTFAGAAPLIGPGSLEASGGQQALSVTPDLAEAQRLVVVWDQRVTPSHSVAVVGQESVPEAPLAVETSDASAPTFEVLSATQGAGLGNDTLLVEFSGPRVVPDSVASGANWVLTAGSFEQSLADCELDFDVAQQRLTIETAANANLHGSFTLRVEGLISVADTPVSAAPLSGNASGDSTAPTVVGLVQNLSADAFGRVVDLSFSEAMDPLFAGGLVNYTVGFPTFPTEVVQTTASSVRLRFAQPVIPGLANLTVIGLLDAHGNAFSGAPIAVQAGATFANGYQGNPEVRTIAGALNDQLRIVTTQALSPAQAALPGSWSLSVDGNPVDLASASFAYDLLNSTLVVGLGQDFANGLAFSLTPQNVLEIDGQAFSAPFNGTVGGDTLAPGISFITQNRTFDPTGRTLDVRVSEALRETSAETLANWTPSGGVSLVSASWEGGYDVVRLTLDGPAVPGVVTLAVSGLLDLAGNQIAPVSGVQSFSTDTTPPAIVNVVAAGIEGPDNDEVRVTFSDGMYPADVEAPFRWLLESPPGTPITTDFSSATWDSGTNTATLVLADSVSFQQGQELRLDFQGVRDLGGNPYAGGAVTAPISVESSLPAVEALFVLAPPQNNQVVVRFDEGLGAFDDADAVYQLHDQAGNVIAQPSAVALSSDGRGVRLTFGQVVAPGINTLTVRGLADLAGNPAFALFRAAIEPESGQQAGFAPSGGSFEILPGERNDRVLLSFSEPMSALGLESLGNYVLYDATTLLTVPLAGAEATPLSSDQLLLTLAGASNLSLSHSYEVRFQGLYTAQGVGPAPLTNAAGSPSGDATPPGLSASRVRLDPQNPSALLVDLSEACQLAGTANLFVLDGVPATGLVELGPRSVRLSFPSAPTVGQSLSVTATDLAGNVGNQTLAVAAADQTPPLLSGAVQAVAVAGLGGDYLEIPFNEPLDPALALDPSRYSLTLGSTAVNLAQAQLEYSSVGDTVRLFLPAGVEFDQQVQAQLSIVGLADFAGNAIQTPINTLPVFAGDTQDPQLVSAFVDRRFDPTGRTLALLFSEACDPSVMLSTSNYLPGGGQAVSAVTALGERAVRLQLAAPFLDGEDLLVPAVRDLAGNSSANQSLLPLF
jgi:hypothetical protein